MTVQSIDHSWVCDRISAEKYDALSDRVNKPLEYAEAGIPHFWRIEPAGDVPVIHTYALDPGQRIYRKTGEFTGTAKAEVPFPVKIDLMDV